jgi:3-oxoacyl-[acyl-carrier protein] reductase
MAGLDRRVAIVTGSARGIGRAIALALARAGADIVVTDTDAAGIAETAREIEAMGRKALGVTASVADAAQVAALVKKTQETFPTIDILVNNAGVTRDGLLMRMEEKDWDLVLTVNLKGPFLLTKAVCTVMMRQRYGRIVNIASVVGQTGNAGQANYSSSKGGLISFTRSVAKELGSRNVTCNAVAPGYIATPMTEKLDAKTKDAYLKTIPLNRAGTPEDVAGVVVFLASDEAAYITGQVIGIDGGMFMR